METLKSSRNELEKRAVEIITARLNYFVAEKGRAVLGIPGGRSVAGIFERLKYANVLWEKVHIWWVDERYDGSNYEVAASTFLSKVPLENIHRFKGDIEKYNKAFADSFDASAPDFDIILLGAGEDGHVASLFPDHESIRYARSLYSARNARGSFASALFFHINDAPKAPPTRMSASKELLAKADTALLLFFGDAKKDAYEKFASDDFNVEELPANIVKAVKNSYVFVTE